MEISTGLSAAYYGSQTPASASGAAAPPASTIASVSQPTSLAQSDSSTFSLTTSDVAFGVAKARFLKVETANVKARLQADSALKLMEDRISKIQADLKASLPRIKPSDWDFSLKGGSLHVSGNLDADAQKLVEQKLNGDNLLGLAVKSYLKSAQTYLEATAENPGRTENNESTGKFQLYNFHDVQKQLEGKLAFKDLISQSWEHYRNPSTGKIDSPGNTRGAYSFDLLASRLTATPLK